LGYYPSDEDTTYLLNGHKSNDLPPDSSSAKLLANLTNLIKEEEPRNNTLLLYLLLNHFTSFHMSWI